MLLQRIKEQYIQILKEKQMKNDKKSNFNHPKPHKFNYQMKTKKCNKNYQKFKNLLLF